MNCSFNKKDEGCRVGKKTRKGKNNNKKLTKVRVSPSPPERRGPWWSPWGEGGVCGARLQPLLLLRCSLLVFLSLEKESLPFKCIKKTATLEPTGIYHSWLLTLGKFLIKHAPTQEVLLHRYVVYYSKICVRCCTRQKEKAFLRIVWYVVLLQCWNVETLPSYARIFPKWLMVNCHTSSVLSWCCGPSSTLLRPSRLRCLLLGFLALALSPLPWLRRRTGLVSHFFNVFPVVPERLGPGEPVGKEVTDVCGCSDAEDSDLTSEVPTG